MADDKASSTMTVTFTEVMSPFDLALGKFIKETWLPTLTIEPSDEALFEDPKDPDLYSPTVPDPKEL